MAVSSSEGSTGKRSSKGNPYRCKVCGNLASSDLYCSPCRAKNEADEDYPLDRKTYFGYGSGLGRDGPFFSKKGFGVVKKEYGIARKRW